jgi:hypothetical protein
MQAQHMEGNIKVKSPLRTFRRRLNNSGTIPKLKSKGEYKG